MYENISQVRDLYLEQKTITEICSLTNIHHSTVRKYLKKLNIYDPMRDKRSKNQILIEQTKELYLSGTPVMKIAEKLGTCHDTTIRWLKDLKIYNPNQYVFAEYTNLDFFKVIDVEEKAYWLGFIYADGCIQNGNKLDINLKSSDKNHLQKLSNIFNSSLYFYSRTLSTGAIVSFVRLIIRSEEMYYYLTKCGIEERKTYSNNSTVLKCVSDDLIHHFVRGYFDGDGSVSYQNCDKRKCRVNILGTYDFIPQVQQIMENNIPKLSKISIVLNGDIVCSLNYGKQDNFKEIYKWLYNGATVWLERKRDKFEEILKEL